MKTNRQKLPAIVAGLLSLVLVAGVVGCAHHWVEVDVSGEDGHSHHGYYDNDHHWHGGWYDEDHHYHEDSRDWHH